MTIIKLQQPSAPTRAGGHNNTGCDLADQGRMIEAAACFRKALRLEPALVEALCNLATVAEPAEAIRAARSAVRHQPDNPKAHYALARALLAGGYDLPAIGCLRRFLVLLEDDPDDLHGMRVVADDARSVLSRLRGGIVVVR